MDSDNDDILSLVEQYTATGHSFVEKGIMKEALTAFQTAFKLAVQSEDEVVERSCAFNLGAVYIALKDPIKGLDYLHQALPPESSSEHHASTAVNDDDDSDADSGDLFFNFALAHETLEDYEEALRYYGKALSAYHQYTPKNSFMEGEVCIKQGMMYSKLLKPIQAAEHFCNAGKAYAQVNAHRRQATALLYQANQLLGGAKQDECVSALETCVGVCQKLPQTKELGKLLNEIGLTFMLSKQYYRAATSFESALPVIRSCKLKNPKHEGVILQNLGASYNALGEYQRALPVHKAATVLHGELGNRSSQGQSYCNLAYAYAQLEKYDNAGEAYLLGLQAFRDTGDRHSQWQALEGLGSVSFHQCRYDKAVQFFELALNVISTSEFNTSAQSRIVTKLSDALQHQLEQQLTLQGALRGFTPMAYHRGYESDIGFGKTYVSNPISRHISHAGHVQPFVVPQSMSAGNVCNASAAHGSSVSRKQQKETSETAECTGRVTISQQQKATALTNGDLTVKFSSASSVESLNSSVLEPTPVTSEITPIEEMNEEASNEVTVNNKLTKVPKMRKKEPSTLRKVMQPQLSADFLFDRSDLALPERGRMNADEYHRHVAEQNDFEKHLRQNNMRHHSKKIRLKWGSKVCGVM